MTNLRPYVDLLVGVIRELSSRMEHLRALIQNSKFSTNLPFYVKFSGTETVGITGAVTISQSQASPLIVNAPFIATSGRPLNSDWFNAQERI